MRCRIQRFRRLLKIFNARQLDVPGNTTPVAEFNFMADADAVQAVLHSPLARDDERFQILPLDITCKHRLSWARYTKLVDPTFGQGIKQGKTPLTAFTSAFLEGTKRIMASFGLDYMELHGTVPST